MGHLLARLKGVPPDELKKILLNDAPEHAKEGLFLEHLWINEDNEDEVLFLFRAEDLTHIKNYINNLHSDALEQNPQAKLPHMTYLAEK